MADGRGARSRGLSSRQGLCMVFCEYVLSTCLLLSGGLTLAGFDQESSRGVVQLSESCICTCKMLSSSRTVHRLRVEVERGVSSCAPACGGVSSVVVVCGCSIVSVVFACLVMERVRRRVMVISRCAFCGICCVSCVATILLVLWCLLL